MSIDKATYDFYQGQAPHYSLNPALGPSRHLDAFLDRLSPAAEILELGCGGGRDAAHMIERGFKIDATDGIPAMVRKANERHDLNARLMQFSELSAYAAYDAIWAHACLLHCPRAELPSVLTRIHTAIRPGGFHYASFKLGDGEGRDLLGRLHNFPTPEWLRETFFAAQFAVVAEDIFAGKASDGTQRDWMALTVTKS
ncbi:class I SAM-dependent methyltransferase [Erythrobacter insulae]|uniref:Class I SAM-dependent methyltransferase n=1 Tax=Erythrobacter insulae TaxID=2584124 RepID=A0A547PE17_9SPHN|nr:class I SAM-dependent methyltransferase [Erythrobacter insulae]TRD12367.1 class I SAM-dependent methyltransferase [Erythrobacter insulae]